MLFASKNCCIYLVGLYLIVWQFHSAFPLDSSMRTSLVGNESQGAGRDTHEKGKMMNFSTVTKNVYRVVLGTLLAWLLVVGMVGPVSAMSTTANSAFLPQSPYAHCLQYRTVHPKTKTGKVTRVCSKWSSR